MRSVSFGMIGMMVTYDVMSAPSSMFA